MDYVALYVKSSYSMLESLNHIPKLVKRAYNLGYKALAITDHNNMFGVMKFYEECHKYNVSPIIGVSLDYKESLIILLAKNNKGYINICKLSTLISERALEYDDLVKYKDDLILIMTSDNYNEEVYNIYIYHYIGYNDNTKRINKLDNVYITEVCYLEENDDQYLDYLLMIKKDLVIGEYEFHHNTHKYLLSQKDLININETDILNTKKIANMCNVTFSYNDDLLPVYNSNKDADEYLKYLCYKGLNKRLKELVDDKYYKRLEYELGVIKKLNFSNYFLIVYDYVFYAKTHNILVGDGRGSAPGSLVAFTLGITDIDPLKYDLLFERFLNELRQNMPDIDIDFDATKREQVIDYVKNKYGTKKVVGIITFSTLKAKQVIRDVARVLRINNNLIDEVCFHIKDNTLDKSYQNNIKLKTLIDSSTKLTKLFEIAKKLEDLPRHTSIHAAAIVMSKYDIDNIIPLYKNELGGYLTAYSMEYLEQLGLLKMDFLGIKNLTLIDEVINNVREYKKLNITFTNIPDNDQKTIELFTKGDTIGIFQFESEGMRKFLKKLKPDCFDDLVAANALFRPGPSDYIDTYIKRKQGHEVVEYPHKDLKPVLEYTYGIIVYQEQIMQVSHIMASYTLGEADILRRAMAKKKESILINERDKFIERSMINGYSKEVADNVYKMILKFSGYGFNKSHSVAYAKVAYKMAFLKNYFYNYFLCSLLTSVIGSEIKIKTYITEARKNNIKILPPNINISTTKFIINNDNIISPLSMIKNIGVMIANDILRQRQKKDFVDFVDFVVRMKKSINMSDKLITILVQVGCFDDLGYNRKTLINNLDKIYNYVYLIQDDSIISVERPVLSLYDEYPKEELILFEKELLGLYLSNHPLTKYRDNNDINTTGLENSYSRYITIKVMVERVKEIITKKGETMAFITGSDEYSEIDITVFPRVYQNMIIKRNNIIKVIGKVERRYSDFSLVATKIDVLN